MTKIQCKNCGQENTIDFEEGGFYSSVIKNMKEFPKTILFPDILDLIYSAYCVTCDSPLTQAATLARSQELLIQSFVKENENFGAAIKKWICATVTAFEIATKTIPVKNQKSLEARIYKVFYTACFGYLQYTAKNMHILEKENVLKTMTTSVSEFAVKGAEERFISILNRFAELGILKTHFDAWGPAMSDFCSMIPLDAEDLHVPMEASLLQLIYYIEFSRRFMKD